MMPTDVDTLARNFSSLEIRVSHIENLTAKLDARTESTREEVRETRSDVREVHGKINQVQDQMQSVASQGKLTLELLQEQVRAAARREEARDNTEYELKKQELAHSQANWQQFWKIVGGALALVSAAISGGYFAGQYSAQDEVQRARAEVEDMRRRPAYHFAEDYAESAEEAGSEENGSAAPEAVENLEQ